MTVKTYKQKKQHNIFYAEISTYQRAISKSCTIQSQQ